MTKLFKQDLQMTRESLYEGLKQQDNLLAEYFYQITMPIEVTKVNIKDFPSEGQDGQQGT